MKTKNSNLKLIFVPGLHKVSEMTKAQIRCLKKDWNVKNIASGDLFKLNFYIYWDKADKRHRNFKDNLDIVEHLAKKRGLVV